MKHQCASRVRQHLSEILASRLFAEGTHHAKFLRFVVESELSGDGGRLSAKVVAEDCLKLPPSEEANLSARSAKQQARDQLARYYQDNLPTTVRIAIVPDTFRPQFDWLGSPATAGSPDGQHSTLAKVLRVPATNFGALVAYIATIAILALTWDMARERWQQLALRIALLVFLAAALVLHVVPSLLEWRRRKRLWKIGRQPEGGHFRLTPRTNLDESTFERADGVHKLVLDWLQAPGETVLFLTGKSGSGKTSILRAYALPHLNRTGRTRSTAAATILSVPPYGDPLKTIIDQLIPICNAKDLPKDHEATPAQVLRNACKALKGTRLLLIFDQFEAFTILGNEQAKGNLKILLDDLHNDPPSNLSLLFVVRTDYLGLLEDFGFRRLRALENWIEVPAFTEAAALDFLRAGGAATDERMYDVLREASDLEESVGLIRPVVANLCGLVLSRFAIAPRNPFKKGALLRGFLKESIDLPELVGMGPTVLSALISAQGTKLPPRDVPTIARDSGVDPKTVLGCLSMLSRQDRCIVRSLDALGSTWEISHDFLAKELDRLLPSWHVSLIRRVRPAVPWLLAAAITILAVTTQRSRPEPLVELAELGWVHSREGDVDVFDWGIIKGTAPINASAPWFRYFPKLHLKNVGDQSLYALAGILTLRSLTVESSTRFNQRWDRKNTFFPFSTLLNLEHLDLSGYPLSNLHGLENLVYLKRLSVSHISFALLDGPWEIKKLPPSMTELRATGLNLYDLSFVSSLTKLEVLKLDHNSITDITPIKTLARLRDFSIVSNHVSDIRPLAHLRGLEIVDLSDNQVEDLAVFDGFPRITKLAIGGPRTNVLVLPHLPSLEYLVISDAPGLKKIVDIDNAPGLLDIRTSSPLSTATLDALRQKGIRVNSPILRLQKRLPQIFAAKPANPLYPIRKGR